jgi:glyoxylase-like metal-dependent hydrolase (beta-lactamase superfamily II)
MATLTTFKVGYCTHIACIAQQGAGFGICKFPSQAWLIEVDEFKWLWDTGYSDHFQQYTQSGLFKIYQKITPVHLERKESLKDQLITLGISPSDIQHIIISHFHSDHIAGLKDFPQSDFICAKSGWDKTKTLRGFQALKHAFIPNLIPENFESRVHFLDHFEKCILPEELRPFKQGYILPNSQQQVILIPLPGHAVGHIGAFVKTDQGWTLLASDAAWSSENFKNLKKPSRLAYLIMDNAQAYNQTLLKLKELSQNPQVTIYLSHEDQ